MFMLNILHYLRGYVRFTADGGCPEKLLDRCVQGGISLWEIRRKGTVLEARVAARRYAQVRQIGRSCGCRVEAAALRGVPFRVKKYQKRGGILAGILFFIAILWFFSSFIWTVEVTGATGSQAREITQVLSELGVKPGAFPLLLNVRQIEQEALVRLPGLSGLHLNIIGSDAQIEVRLRSLPPDIVPDGTPCNVRALADGQVINLEVYTGKAMVRKGDTITKNGLLISGVIEDRDGAVRFVHASGKAVARTKRELTVEIPFTQQVQQPTGVVYRRTALNIFSLSIPFYFHTPSGSFRRTISTSPLVIFGRELPFSVTTRVYTQVEAATLRVNEAQAEKQAEQTLERKEAVELAGVKILTKTLTPAMQTDKLSLTAHYTCEEDIAYQEIIEIQ